MTAACPAESSRCNEMARVVLSTRMSAKMGRVLMCCSKGLPARTPVRTPGDQMTEPISAVRGCTSQASSPSVWVSWWSCSGLSAADKGPISASSRQPGSALSIPTASFSALMKCWLSYMAACTKSTCGHVGLCPERRKTCCGSSRTTRSQFPAGER